MSEKSSDVVPCTAFEFDMKGTNLYVAVLCPDLSVLLFQITFKAQWNANQFTIHSFLYKNIFYKNIEAEICEILRILKNKPEAEILKRI